MPDFLVKIEVKDVTKGDVRGLVEGILETFGDDFDAPRGDFSVSVSVKDGANYFPVDLDAEDE